MTKNIKEIGKELLGKSLNSFHRKTGLTQLEENNKMQDGILNGILSQVDDAYMEKTEQSNVIHLDGSGDGVVVVDSIEGNTMVNLFSKITSLSQVMNFNVDTTLSDGWLTVTTNKDFGTVATSIYANKNFDNIKTNTKYTLVFNYSCVNNVSGDNNVRIYNDVTNSGVASIVTKTSGIYKLVFTTPETIDKSKFRIICYGNGVTGSAFKIGDFILLEGDYTDKEINYFEGLQSSFEEKVNDERQYEIEILMNNKNLINNEEGYESSYASWIPYIRNTSNKVTSNTYNATFTNRGVGFLVKDLKPNTQYTLSIPSLLKDNLLAYALYDKQDDIDTWGLNIQGQGGLEVKKVTFTTPNRKVVAVVGVYGNYSVLNNNGANDGTVTVGNYNQLQLEIGSDNTNFVQQKQNKIKLLLNEPLRAIDNIKDGLYVRDGKLMVERNCGQVVFSGDVSENWGRSGFTNDTIFSVYWDNMFINSINMVCDRFSLNPNIATSQNRIEGLYFSNSTKSFRIAISKSKLITQDIEGFRQWLSDNPTTVVYKLAKPYYEEVLNEYGEPILLEGYENGTLYVDSIIVPTTTVRYTPKMESLNTLKEVSNNNVMLTSDINDTIVPYMMEVDMMIMEKEVALMSHRNIRKIGAEDMTNMQKRTQQMLERLIKGRTLTEQECQTRVTTYLNADKITKMQYDQLLVLIDSTYNG